MAISSNTHRSLSPVSRNPQGTNNGPRRSFNGNPLARSSATLNHVNSPSDSSRKSLNLISKEGFSEFKENEKKAKQGSIQRGTKSFMAPTISAISKKSPSTRKKVLSERNETVRSSFDEDESGSKSEFGLDYQVIHNNLSFKPRTLNYQPVEADYVDVTEPPTSTQPSPLEFSEETALVLPEPKTISIGSAEKTTNPSSSPSYPATLGSAEKATNPLSSPYPAIAPLDSDPHLPPYDPKTNYLSPRPRFLHYKPRPRIEVCVQNEEGVEFVQGGKNLEESFSSGSCSDTETTEQAPSSEDGYSSEFVSEEENQSLVTVTKLDYTQRKRTCNSRSFLGSKIAPFLLVFVIACLSFQVSDTPVLPQSAYRVQTCGMDATAKIVESVIVNFKDLGSNLKLWSVNTISYLSTLMPVPSLVEDLGPLYFNNTAVFSEEPLLYDECGFKKFGNGHVEVDSDRIDEVIINEVEGIGELQTYIEVTEHVSTHEIVGVSEIEEQENLDLHAASEPVDTAIVWQSSDSDNSIHTQSADLGVATDTSELDNPVLAENKNIEEDVPNSGFLSESQELDYSALTQSPNSGFLSESQELDDSALTQSPDSGFLSENQEMDDSALSQSPDSGFLSENREMEVGHQDSDVDTFSRPTEGLELDAGLSQSTDVEALDDDLPLGNLFSAQNIGIMLSVVTVAAAAAAASYTYLECKKATISKKTELKSLSFIGDSGDPYRVSSPPKPSQVMMVDDSCCSEVSSSFKGGSPHGLDDALSNGKQQTTYPTKREVMPSSSEYSYGSFTTYEKIHSKHHGCIDDEVVTPVRRSSRIRKITSP